ncbi:MAG TPA: crosslink repair DNA glycosylase YcaQ family protein [Vicinamibacterales bacterium]|nr:crosslink repair DNA glycosylase YcaQ family protein [Vicinamibacterales bacterium]
MNAPTLDLLRRHAVKRTFFTADLQQAIDTFGFIQADPIRAPARAQDLTLRHRVPGYRAGDLERRYATLRVEEDFLVNYGFVARPVHELLHPRGGRAWPPARRRRADAILAFVRERGIVHPRDVEQQFALGRVTNYWGGSSNATTHLLEAMHYRGWLRVAGRDAGVRLYGSRDATTTLGGGATPLDPDARLDALVDVIVRKYAPLPAPSLAPLVRRLRWGAPQWATRITAALGRARQRLAHVRIDGVEWFWPADEAPDGDSAEDTVRLLAPFDPVVWDRRRFELFWGWAYRFEAYTPVSKRKLGYYALPLLWRDVVIGWANASLQGHTLIPDLGFVSGRPPRSAAFRRALDEEVERMRAFLKA